MGLDSKRANTSSNTNIYKPVQKPDVYKPISDDLYILAAQEKYRQAQIQRSNIIEDRINRINKFLTHLQGLETAFNKCYPNDTGKMEIIEKELSQYTGEDYLNDANYKQVFKYLHEWEEYFAQNVITCQNANR